jgi:hypothetical protein
MARRRWIVRDAAHTPAFWVIGLGMLLIALLAGGVMMYLVGRRRTAIPHGPPFDAHDDGDDGIALSGHVAEA